MAKQIFGGFGTVETYSKVFVFPFTVVADNKDEAIGKLLSYVKKQYPTEKGYCHHDVGLTPATDEQLKMIGEDQNVPETIITQI